MVKRACPLCGGTEHELVFSYEERPDRETDFGIPPEDYHREFWRCESCGLMAGEMDLDPARLYEGGYVDATYTEKGLSETYERVMALPPERSDNVQRVRRINEQLEGEGEPRTLLDVGSGLGVFPARMKEAGWSCTALDPDPRAAAHLSDGVGVEAVCADFMEADDLGTYSLVTLNKVLEHLEDPTAMLARCLLFLEPGGTVYIEVPDAAAAADPDGPDREEFFIEHLWAFSLDSLALLADRAGFETRRAESVREPSDKYTLFAFLSPCES